MPSRISFSYHDSPSSSRWFWHGADSLYASLNRCETVHALLSHGIVCQVTGGVSGPMASSLSQRLSQWSSLIVYTPSRDYPRTAEIGPTPSNSLQPISKLSWGCTWTIPRQVTNGIGEVHNQVVLHQFWHRCPRFQQLDCIDMSIDCQHQSVSLLVSNAHASTSRLINNATSLCL